MISDNAFERIKTHSNEVVVEDRGYDGARHSRIPDLDIVQDPRA